MKFLLPSGRPAISAMYSKKSWKWNTLTHWGRVTQICVSKFTIIGSDNSLSPIRRQAIIWANAGILLIRTLGRNFSEILSQIHSLSNKKMHLKMSSVKFRPFCLGLNVLTWRERRVYHKVRGEWRGWQWGNEIIGQRKWSERGRGRGVYIYIYHLWYEGDMRTCFQGLVGRENSNHGQITSCAGCH